MAQTKVSDNVISINANIDPNAPTGPVLKMVNGQPMVSSQEVASHFGKRHADLIRSVAAIIRNAPESFNERNFALVEYTDPKGEKRPAYELTRDGFVIIAMGFTGPKAIKWKIAYIQAFNAMEATLAGQPATVGPISLAQQQEIRELIQAKVSAYPKDQHRRVYGQVYKRLAIKFKVPRYQEIPVAVFHDARDYIISMDVRGTTALPDAEAEPQKALPETKSKLAQNMAYWANAYSGAPLSATYFDQLTHRAVMATTAFEKELQEIRVEALRPFREDRNWGVASPFDFLMDPLTEMFSNGEDSIRPIYRLYYQAIQGLKWANEILDMSRKQ